MKNNIKIILLTIILITIFNVPAFGYDLLEGELDPWTEEQKTMQLSLTILAILDYGTTNWAMQYPDKYIEFEPGIYGHPTSQEILEYGSKLYFGHLFISYLLPDELRNYWLKFGLGYQIYCVGNNFYLGCKLKF
jgi:hypothetical protein